VCERERERETGRKETTISEAHHASALYRPSILRELVAATNSIESSAWGFTFPNRRRAVRPLNPFADEGPRCSCADRDVSLDPTLIRVSNLLVVDHECDRLLAEKPSQCDAVKAASGPYRPMPPRLFHATVSLRMIQHAEHAQCRSAKCGRLARRCSLSLRPSNSSSSKQVGGDMGKGLPVAPWVAGLPL